MLEDSQPSVKCQQLLRELKSTVEGLLASQVPNVWSVFGGLNRLHNSVEKIFKHASVGCNEDVSRVFRLFWLGSIKCHRYDYQHFRDSDDTSPVQFIGLTVMSY